MPCNFIQPHNLGTMSNLFNTPAEFDDDTTAVFIRLMAAALYAVDNTIWRE